MKRRTFQTALLQAAVATGLSSATLAAQAQEVIRIGAPLALTGGLMVAATCRSSRYKTARWYRSFLLRSKVGSLSPVTR